MNATLRLLACVLFVGSTACADESRIVVLDNENLIEGQVTKVDTGYRVTLAAGGDLTLPFKKVLAVVADRKAAFAEVQRRADLKDADERLRLARWCLVHDMHAEAIDEARAAAKLRPGFATADRFVKTLEAMAPPPSTTIVPASAIGPKIDSVSDLKPIDYNTESFPMFATRVNTILVNACASCHGDPATKVFRLTRLGGRAGATQNLMSALPYINVEDPVKSPLLLKSLTPHGGGTEAPLRARTHPAYTTLETWARLARATEGTTSVPPIPLRLPEPKKLPDLEGPGPLPMDVLPASVGPMVKTGESFGTERTPPKPVKGPTVDDPFDPEQFNGPRKADPGK